MFAVVEAETSTAYVESRIDPLSPSLGPGLGFSVDAGNSEDGSSRSSMATSAPRVPLPRCDHASVALSPREHERGRAAKARASRPLPPRMRRLYACA